MAKTISDEEIQLRKKARRRLIGSIALVLLAAILLPMVLDKEPKLLRQDISIEIPKPDASGFTSIVVPIAEPKNSQGSPQTENDAPPAIPVPAEGQGKSLTMSEKLETKPLNAASKPVPAETKPTTDVKPVPKAEKPKRVEIVAKVATPAKPHAPEAKPSAQVESKTEAVTGSGFVVQLGAFASAANATQLQQKLNANGIKSYTDMLKTPKGVKTRVRAGPFATREAAEKAQAKLKTIGLNGIVAEKQ